MLRAACLLCPEPINNVPPGSGIYATETDFQQGKLTTPVSCRNKKDRIQINDFWNRPYITVFYMGEKRTYRKEAIFGVRDCDGNDYRFFQRQPYQIREVRSIVIYRQIRLGPNPGVGGRQRVVPIVRYYFSTHLSTDIRPLTKTALKQAFPANHTFHTLLDTRFRRAQDDLSAFDSFHAMFQVNWLLQVSLNEYF